MAFLISYDLIRTQREFQDKKENKLRATYMNLYALLMFIFDMIDNKTEYNNRNKHYNILQELAYNLKDNKDEIRQKIAGDTLLRRLYEDCNHEFSRTLVLVDKILEHIDYKLNKPESIQRNIKNNLDELFKNMVLLFMRHESAQGINNKHSFILSPSRDLKNLINLKKSSDVSEKEKYDSLRAISYLVLTFLGGCYTWEANATSLRLSNIDQTKDLVSSFMPVMAFRTQANIEQDGIFEDKFVALIASSEQVSLITKDGESVRLKEVDISILSLNLLKERFISFIYDGYLIILSKGFFEKGYKFRYEFSYNRFDSYIQDVVSVKLDQAGYNINLLKDTIASYFKENKDEIIQRYKKSTEGKYIEFVGLKEHLYENLPENFKLFLAEALPINSIYVLNYYRNLFYTEGSIDDIVYAYIIETMQQKMAFCYEIYVATSEHPFDDQDIEKIACDIFTNLSCNTFKFDEFIKRYF